MIRPRVFLLALAAAVAGVAQVLAQVPADLQLPDFYRTNYEPSKRDPLVDASTAPTLVGTVSNSRQISGGDSLKKLLKTITDQIQARLVVGGVASSPDGRGRAILSGMEVATGDVFIIPISQDLNSQILGVMRTYSVNVRRVSIDKDTEALALLVAEISPNGVVLKLPGFPNPICALPYDRRIRLNQPRIEPPPQK